MNILDFFNFFFRITKRCIFLQVLPAYNDETKACQAICSWVLPRKPSSSASGLWCASTFRLRTWLFPWPPIRGGDGDRQIRCTRVSLMFELSLFFYGQRFPSHRIFLLREASYESPLCIRRGIWQFIIICLLTPKSHLLNKLPFF